MIRYLVTPAQLRTRIEEERPGWLERAKRRTDGFRLAGAYRESSGIWSEIKPVFMRLQHFKCAYCERRLEASNIEHDLEHYRPKGNVRAWPEAHHGLAYDFPTGGALDGGYYLLAYAVDNYCAACKTCNTNFKNDYFPVAGARGDPAQGESRAFAPEKPFVLYPIGRRDSDPEKLLGFEGIVPKPLKTRGHGRWRAIVTIDFLDLDGRETLRFERAQAIEKVGIALKMLELLPGDPLAQGIVERSLLPSAAHVNCSRAFVRLFEADRPRANAVMEGVQAYLQSDPLGTGGR